MSDRLKEMQNQLKKHDRDTGSTEFQIASLTADIQRLAEHFATHKKDCNGRRGLLKKVSARKRFLLYLKRTDEEKYKKVLSALDLKR